MRVIQQRGQASWVEGLGGAQWGLLPALASAPWLAQTGQAGDLRPVCFVLFACLIASYDLASRRIPNQLNLMTACAGWALGMALGGASGIWDAFAGSLVGFGLMAVFFFLGAVGAGDVKAVAALAAFLDPWGAVSLFVFIALCGGVMALIWAWAHLGFRGFAASFGGLRNAGARMTLPYGVAIAAGAFLLLAQGGMS